MTAEKSFLRTGVGYVKYFAKGTWQRYKGLGIWGKVSLTCRLTHNPWAMLSPKWSIWLTTYWML